MMNGRVNPKATLEAQGITGLGNVYYNYIEPALVEAAVAGWRVPTRVIVDQADKHAALALADAAGPERLVYPVEANELFVRMTAREGAPARPSAPSKKP